MLKDSISAASLLSINNPPLFILSQSHKY